MNKKIRITLSLKLLEKLKQNLKPDETLDSRITRLLLRGLNREGLTLEE